MLHNLARKRETCLTRVRECEARVQTLEAARGNPPESVLVGRQRHPYDSVMSEAIAFDTHRFVKRPTDFSHNDPDGNLIGISSYGAPMGDCTG